MKLLIYICVLAVAGDWEGVESLRIGSFNVDKFGKSKVEKTGVLESLAKIIRRFDITLIQEIREKGEYAIQALTEKINKISSSKYDYEISERLGRSKSKEQYAFLYRKDAGIKLIDTYQYPIEKDEFERPPFAVKILSQKTGIKNFVLVGIHVKPTAAEKEINSLVTVHDVIKKHWNNDNILIMGDLNADCSFVTKSQMGNLKLREDKFKWWLGDDVDTTAKGSGCAYDRFVMSGNQFEANVVPGSARVYNFKEELGLTDGQVLLLLLLLLLFLMLIQLSLHCFTDHSHK